MTLMGLEIGGVETHVLELSKALAAKGHDITVVSNGGVFVSQLTEAGVRHVQLPLNKKKPMAVIKSYFGLSKLFKEETFDIVHAHARIPAFICGLLHKRYKFRFITSAHWVFKVTPLWKLITNWGEKSIAVSEDIKQYLIDNYNYYPDNVSVTINGIDMEKFAPGKDDAEANEIREEYGISENDKVILHVSRIDRDRSAVSFMLCDSMNTICADRKNENVKLLIVGGGNDFDALKEKAESMNASLGRNAVILAGAQTRISDFIKASDFFVGVSRAALEGMSAALPTILAGNEGYLGIYKSELFKKAYDGNFCCRDTMDPTPELLARDIEELLNMSEGELLSIGKINRDLIEKCYSVDKMAEDYLAVYRDITPYKSFKYPDVVISGYYGFGNMGDDSFLQIMISLLKKYHPDIKITVLSSSPKKTARIYGVNSIYRYRLLKIFNTLKRAKLLISGGGTLLQNETSSRSLFYYTTVMSLAKKAGTKIMVYANGIGPLNGEKAKKKALFALKSADAVSMREPTSHKEVKEVYGIENAVLSADPAVCMERCSDKRLELIEKRLGIESDKKYFAVAVRPFEKDEEIIKKVADFCIEAEKKYGLYPLFIPMQSTVDIEISNKLYKMCGEKGCVVSNVTAKELLGILNKTVFVLGMRLHVLIYAFAAIKPMIAISYDPKVRSFMDSVNMPYCVEAAYFDSKTLSRMLEELMTELPVITHSMEEKLEDMRISAHKDAQTAVELAVDGM